MTVTDMLLTPLRREKLYEGVISQIKSLISSSDLQTGQKLPSERELAERLKVSRVVVREALRSLEQSGFIEVRSGARGGAFVVHNLHKPLADSGRHLFTQGKLTLHHFSEGRRAIECASVALAAARATGDDIASLRTVNRRLLDDLSDNTKLREHNAAFHIAIAEIGGNPLMKLLVQSLMELLDMVNPRSMQTPEFIRNTFDRHEAIIGAIQKRDAALCQELMGRDVEFTVKLKLRDAPRDPRESIHPVKEGEAPCR